MTDPRKFTVSYGRTIQTQPYETMRVSLTVEHYVGEVSYDYAFKEAKNKVEEWINKSRRGS